MSITTVADALLADVIAHPDQDFPRMAYADWLEEEAGRAEDELAGVRYALERLIAEHELDAGGQLLYGHGDHDGDGRCDNCHRLETLRDREGELVPLAGGRDRAEFIRVQCELEPLRSHGHGSDNPHGGDCPTCFRVAQLERREQFPLAAHGYGWCDGLAGPGLKTGGMGKEATAVTVSYCEGACHVGTFRFTFRRGFVESVTLPLAAWETHGPALVRASPLSFVTLPDQEPAPDLGLPGFTVGSYGWWCCNTGNPGPDPEDLPAPLWHLLGGTHNPGRWKWYPDRPAALAALSAAALALARRGAL